eukprot:368882_1
METYVGEQDKVNKQCPNKDKPLTRYTADPGCDLFFIKDGFEVYADVIACVSDGIDSFTLNGTCDYIPPVTTGSADNAMEINIYYTVIIIILVLMFNML